MADAPVEAEKAIQTHAERERQLRLLREAEALRENLRRRKAQSRGRQEKEADDDE